ncbi:ATP-binding cassette sub-family C member 5-like [Watersipora subatra]|uniref:ATP-binding cassette sub-family C member 5-like n=1 Tax=Watersipora subatra TaxID=2589382 RepID=UPI00355C7EF9
MGEEKEKMLKAKPEMVNGTRVGKMMAAGKEYEPTDEDRAYEGWKHLLPCRPSAKNPKTLPLIAAGPFNFAVAHWATAILYKAYKKGLKEDDLYDTPWKDSADYNSQSFERFWNEELKKHGKEKASVGRAIVRMILTRLIVAMLLTLLFSGFAIIGPIFMVPRILDRQTDGIIDFTIFYACGLGLGLFCLASSLSATFHVNYTAAVRVRGGVLAVAFKKILHQQIQSKSVGELVNLCANDGQRLFDATMLGVFSLGALTSIIGAAYSIYLLGAWGILGFVTFFSFLPVQVLLSKVIFNMRRKAIPITDKRVKLMSEIITAIKLVKMYAWEKSFAKKISNIRKDERKILAKSLMVQSLSAILPTTVPIFSSAFTFLAMTCTGVDLTSTQAFVFISLLNALRFSLGVMPHSMKALAEGRHACQRMKDLLIAEDEKMDIGPIRDSNNLVEISGGSFGWAAGSKTVQENPDTPMANGIAKPQGNGTSAAIKNGKPKNGQAGGFTVAELEPLDGGKADTIVTLKNITMSLKHGNLVGICGAVGSGKTSLIQAMLGMMRKTSGTIAINKEKKIAYVSQQAWIMNATVRENIIFGNEFDEDRYNEVVEACALRADFTQLAAGDKTEIGERGINLSGGQKQRMSIARAVYSDSDIILLDDPLSAVDAHVGQHIFQNCLKGFLKDKTILFVSHQLQFMMGCDYVLVMKDGCIHQEGTHDKLMADENGEYSSLIKSFHDAEVKESEQQVTTSAVVDSVLERQLSKQRAAAATHSISTENLASKRKSTRNSESEGKPVMSLSVRNLAEEHLDGDGMRQRTLSIASMKSAHSVASKNMARSLRRLDANADIISGSVVDLASIADPDDLEFNENNNDDAPTGVLTKGEDMESGQVKMSTYYNYIEAAGGICVVGLVFFAVIFAMSVHSFTNYFLGYWLNQGSGGYMLNITTEDGNYTQVESDSLLYNEKLSLYQAIYGISLIGVIIFSIIKSVVYMRTSLMASSNLHDKVFRKLVASPMSFFDITPSGRILNRFSKDMDEIDVNLPFMSEQFVTNSCVILITVGIIGSVFYYFLIAMVPIIIIFVLLYNVCSKGIRNLKRIENVTRSPLFSHVATTVQGLGTIRAYKKEEQFFREFNRLQDRNNMALFLFQTAMRWSAVRLDILSLLVVLATALFIAFMPEGLIPASYAALALSYAMNMTGLFQFTMRLCIETESRFTSVERITSYIKNLESESPAIVEDCRPDSSWPREGAVKFNKVEMRYRDGLPLVLKGISLDIAAQEKIGIVGRTGSGKSSIGMALFRMMELANGSIVIDGVDISRIGLEDLRSKLSIIPQDPVLFVGTVRYNLDPFKAYTDAELWSALEKCHVKNTILSLDGQLDANIVENGENFSVGERQLLCMARALLRHSKILLLDEATAAIDTETDALIQETIKEAFADCTMFTIAHRLNTVATSDKILVLDDGKVMEFDAPENLLADPESIFAQMMSVQESQKQQAMDGGNKSS